MRTLRLTLPKPHNAQRQVIAEARRFNVVCCGRRFGKTQLGINRTADPQVLTKPVGWFSPTYKMLLEVWREAAQMLEPITARRSTQERRIEFITGGMLEFWSLDNPDAARGRKYQRIIVDEAAMIPNLMDAWNMVLRPTLADYEGDGWFLSTPKGRNGFWRMFEWGQDPYMHDWASWQMPTSANPFIAAGEVEAMRQQMPERVFAQEVLAQFLDDAGGVFRRVRQAATLTPAQPYQGGRYVMGVDWAQRHDFTVLSVMDINTRRQVDLDRFNQIDWALQRGRLRAMAERWNVAAIVAEENSIGGPNIEALQREGLPVYAFQTTALTKSPLIESLALAFEQGEINILDDAVQLNELQAYERTVSPVTGRSRYGAPEGMHDDTVMALALAWLAVTSAITPQVDGFVYDEDLVEISPY